MKKAGCWQIGYGIESGNQRVLDNIRKDITLEKITEATQWAKKVNISVAAFFMLGLPEDNEKNIQNSIKLVNKLRLDRISVRITHPFPGSDLYKRALATGELRKNVEFRYYHNLSFHRNFPYIANGLSKELLDKYRHKFYRKFYLRPAYILRRILEYHEFKGVLNRVVTFLKAIS
jgi:radical SAM superfamily enzyme YgiQ (UPF0313 family)